jgi:hypothetical protein
MTTSIIRKRFLSFTLVRDLVKNPICLDCSHYKEYKHSNLYDELYGDGGESYKLGKCGLYGRQNLVTGQIEFDYAVVCRIDDSKCGEKGKQFNLKWKKKQT